MPVIEAQRASILVPHDHRHINHECALATGCAAPDRPVLRARRMAPRRAHSRAERRPGARSHRPAPPLNVMSCIDLALPAIAPCNTPSGPDQRFGGCGVPRGTAERKAPIWYLDPHCLLWTNRGEGPPCAIAGSWPRGAQRAGPGAGAVAAVHGLSGPGEGGSCRTWEPSTSSGSWNARPPNRLRLAGLRMTTPRWTLSAAIPLS